MAHAEKHRLDFLTLLPQMEARGFGERLMVPTIPAAAFCYLPGWLMNIPSARPFGGGGGVFNLIRRDLFDRVGGHEALKASVVDDIQLGRNARKAGGRTGIGLALDSISLRMYHGFAEISKGLEKNGFFGLLASLPLAALSLGWVLFEGELPFAVLLGGAIERAGDAAPARPPPSSHSKKPLSPCSSSLRSSSSAASSTCASASDCCRPSCIRSGWPA